MQTKGVLNMSQFAGGQPRADNATLEYDAQGKLQIKDDGVITAKILNDAVTALKLATDAVETLKIKDLNVTEAKLAAGAVSQGKLKTSTGEVSGTGHWVLPGGEYGLYPQIKNSNGGYVNVAQIASGYDVTTYTTSIYLTTNGGIMYAKQRYVTASGIDHWVFAMVDMAGNIVAAYQAPDHPMYGNGGDINDVPHPFINNDLTGKEIIILDKADIANLKSKVTNKISILTALNEGFKVDRTKSGVYVPLHTGKFIDKVPERINSLPAGITVKKLKLKV